MANKIKILKTGQNNTGDWLNLQKNKITGDYRVIGQRINYVRGKNVVKWVIVKDGLTEIEGIKLFNKKMSGKRV